MLSACNNGSGRECTEIFKMSVTDKWTGNWTTDGQSHSSVPGMQLCWCAIINMQCSKYFRWYTFIRLCFGINDWLQIYSVDLIVSQAVLQSINYIYDISYDNENNYNNKNNNNNDNDIMIVMMIMMIIIIIMMIIIMIMIMIKNNNNTDDDDNYDNNNDIDIIVVVALFS